MEIVLTKHAQERFELRGINLEMIKDTIVNPEKKVKDIKKDFWHLKNMKINSWKLYMLLKKIGISL